MKLKYQIAVAAMGILLTAGPLLLRQRAPQFITDFFSATTAPLNLAIFRIVFFTIILNFFSIDVIAWFGSLPRELQFPPPGLHTVLRYLPISESLAWGAAVGMMVFAVASMLGLFTRASIVLCLVCSLYALGVPQFFGKVNHYHHVIWFMAILAVSPCADVLSIDSIRKAWKRADHGVIEPPGPSQVYAWPLRSIWLLMGVIYFSAGVWKVWTGGYKWAWSDNPKIMMYNKWMELSGWRPFFRIDHYPLLYKMGGVFTILFELSFIFIILFPAIRFLAPVGGLIFHHSTNWFMKILFAQLWYCYVAFPDWRRVFRYIGRKLFRRDMYILYDGNCRLCRRTVASFRMFDILERVVYLTSLDPEVLKEHDLSWLDCESLMQDMHAVVGRNMWTGFHCYQAWIGRIPPFWPMLPLLYVWPITLLGKRMYRHVADSRTCSLEDRIQRTNREETAQRKRKIIIAATAYIILFAAVLSAVAKLHTWPLAGYPTFEDLEAPEVGVLTMLVETKNGELAVIVPIRDQKLRKIPPERLMGLLNNILALSDESERRVRLIGFWKVWIRENPSLREAVHIKFYRDILSSLPEDQDHNPIRRELIYEFRP